MRLSLGPALSSVRKSFVDTFTRSNQNGPGTASDGTIWDNTRPGMQISANSSTSSSASQYPIMATGMPFNDVVIELRGTTPGAMAALWVADSENWWGVSVGSTQYANVSVSGSYVSTYVSGYGTTYGTNSSGGNNNSTTNPAYTNPGYTNYITVPSYMNSSFLNANQYSSGNTNAFYSYYVTNSGYTNSGFLNANQYAPSNSYIYAYYIPMTGTFYGTRYNASVYTPGYINAGYTNSGSTSGPFYAGGNTNAGTYTPGYVNSSYANTAYYLTGNYVAPSYVDSTQNAGNVNAVTYYNFITGYTTSYANENITTYSTTYGFTRNVTLIQSVNGVRNTITSWATTASALVRSLRVKLTGTQITVQPFLDSELVTQIGSDLVYNATGAVVTPRYGLGLKSSDEQGSVASTGISITKN